MSTRRFQALRRTSLKLAAAGVLCAAFGPAMANDYPTRPISLIASAAPGGTTDIAARMISDPLGKALGQTVVVDNKPGAAGAIAAQSVLRSQPDGYTLLLQYSGFQVITPHVQANIGFDPVADFEPVANVLSAPQVLVVRPDLPIHSLKELIEYAKANPGRLNYASSGNGSLQHMATELLNQMADIQTVHIPYKGTGPALTDLLGGSVDMTITTPPPCCRTFRPASSVRWSSRARSAWSRCPTYRRSPKPAIPTCWCRHGSPCMHPRGRPAPWSINSPARLKPS